MGADQSVESYHVPLVPQSQTEPICIIDPKYCLKQSVQLRLRERVRSLIGDDFKITDPSTGEMKFQISGKPLTPRQKRTLFDPSGEPILNLKRGLRLFKEEYKVYAGNSSDSLTCRVHTAPNIMKSKIWINAPDKNIPGKNHFIVMKSDRVAKSAVIYLGEPKDRGVPIAKVFRPFTKRTLLGVDDYILEVVAGVDIVLMIILCVAFDAHTKDSRLV